MQPIALDAPAKLNLSLAVLGRRPDGHHELASRFALLTLADHLLLTPGCAGLRVTPPDMDVPVDATNLAWRGLVAGLGAEPQLACLALEKLIPSAAGLGGGSSDAAAAWRLGRRWSGAAELPTDDELRALSRIGADVPFFAAQLGSARVTGIGERVEACAAPAASEVVLAVPTFGLSTAAVFAELRPSDWSGEAIFGRNDLLAPARRLRPELDDMFAAVSAAGGVPVLTGSGPTVYALTDDPQRAAAIAGALERAGLRVLRTRLATGPTTIATMNEQESSNR